MRKLLIGGIIITPEGVMEHKAVLFDEKIIAVLDADRADITEAEVIPFKGYLSPGFIDVHLHGAAGCDVMDATAQSLAHIAQTVVQSGTTSFLATTMTMPREDIERALQNVREHMRRMSPGAEVLGVHLEGPFISEAYCGAQDRHYVQRPDTAWVEPWLDVVRMITYAPEQDVDFAFTKYLKDRVVLSLGHSGADYATACEAFDQGARHVTHCFNAMRGLHHREPGIVGAALNRPCSIDLITDTIHVHPDLFAPLFRLKKPHERILITDAIRASFMEDGKYSLGGQEVTLQEGACRLCDGTLAGSVHRMDAALRNMVQHTDFSLKEIIDMLTVNPARLLGIKQKKGQIIPGADADLLILNEDLAIQDIYLRGELYESHHF